MPIDIDYSEAPAPSDSQSRKQFRFMIVFVQLICLPFFPMPLTVYTPLQVVVISVIGWVR